MKGLILDNFYKTINSMKLFVLFVIGAGIALLVTGNDTLLELFVYIAITALSVTALSGMRKDSDAKWNKYELTLPVTRKHIISSKYISYLFWVFAGTVIALVFTGLVVIIHGNVFVYGFRDVFRIWISGYFSLFTLGIGIAVMVGALFYPLAYLLGADKSETLLVISVISSVGLAIFLIWLANRGIGSEAEYYYMRLGAFILTCFLMYLASYFIAHSIYKNKEF